MVAYQGHRVDVHKMDQPKLTEESVLVYGRDGSVSKIMYIC